MDQEQRIEQTPCEALRSTRAFVDLPVLILEVWRVEFFRRGAEYAKKNERKHEED